MSDNDIIAELCKVLDKLNAAYDRKIELLEEIRDYKKEEVDFYSSLK